MCPSKPMCSCAPKFCNQPAFPVLRYVQEYASYLDGSCFTDVRAKDRALTVCGRHSVLGYTDCGTLVKPWLNCGGPCMFVSPFVALEIECTFVCC